MLSAKAQVTLLSVAAALSTLGLKFAAFYLTGSVGLFSDAAESLVNLSASLIALIALAVASRPADATHTFGHDKAEYLSSGAEGVLILLAAAAISWTAVDRLVHPRPLARLDIGMTMSLLAAAINFGVARYVFAQARHYDSIALEADARHLMTDVWTSVGVVLALVLVSFTGWTILDPLVALAVAANIVNSGLKLLRRSFHGLMDYRLPLEEIATIRQVLERHQGEFSSYHGLRTRKSGPQRFIQLHLLMPGKTTIRAAHDLTKTLERELAQALGRVDVTIHVEPVEDRDSYEEELVRLDTGKQ